MDEKTIKQVRILIEALVKLGVPETALAGLRILLTARSSR